MSSHFNYELPSLDQLRALGPAEGAAEFPGFFVAEDPREVLKGKKYSDRKLENWLEQGRRCARCPRYLATPAEGHNHHTHGRGMGGGKRDDRDTELLCHACHSKAQIERRERWNAPRLVKKGGVR